MKRDLNFVIELILVAIIISFMMWFLMQTGNGKPTKPPKEEEIILNPIPLLT